MGMSTGSPHVGNRSSSHSVALISCRMAAMGWELHDRLVLIALGEDGVDQRVQ